MSSHDPGSPGYALITQFDEHSPSVAPWGRLQYGSVVGQSALVEHEVPCPSTGETKSSVMVDTAKRSAARLAPPLCWERISPLLCRCFFSSSKGEGGAAESTSAFGLRLMRRSSKPFGGDRRAPPWLGSHYFHPFSPLFDATTIHNAPWDDLTMLSRSGHFGQARKGRSGNGGRGPKA